MTTKINAVTTSDFATKIGIQSNWIISLAKSSEDFPASVGVKRYGNRDVPLYAEAELTKWFLAYKQSKTITYNLKGKTTAKMPKDSITMRGIAERMGISEVSLGVLKNRNLETFPKQLPEKIENPYGGNKVTAYNLADVEAWVSTLNADRKSKREVKALLPNEWDLVEKAVKAMDSEPAKLLLEKIKQVRIN
jgi:hypothetical protein